MDRRQFVRAAATAVVGLAASAGVRRSTRPAVADLPAPWRAKRLGATFWYRSPRLAVDFFVTDGADEYLVREWSYRGWVTDATWLRVRAGSTWQWDYFERLA